MKWHVLQSIDMGGTRMSSSRANGIGNPFFLMAMVTGLFACEANVTVQAYDAGLRKSRSVGVLRKELRDRTQHLREHENCPTALFARGLAWMELGRPDVAIIDLTHMDYDFNTDRFVIRGWAWKELGEFELAVADFNQAISGYRGALALVRSEKTERDLAIAYNAKAWILATSHNAQIRNGNLATTAALAACQLSDFQNALYLDTLAAAYAESGDFYHAVKWQNKAIERLSINHLESLKTAMRKRLKNYGQNLAHRE